MGGVGTQVTLARLLGNADVEVLRSHAAADGALAAKVHGGHHDEDVICQGEHVLDAIQQRDLDHGERRRGGGAAARGEHLGEALADGGKLDLLQALGGLGARKGALGEQATVELAGLAVHDVIAELGGKLVQKGAAGLQHVAGDLVKVDDPGALLTQQPRDGGLARGDAAGQKRAAHGPRPCRQSERGTWGR